jgi:hypothetical protein
MVAVEPLGESDDDGVHGFEEPVPVHHLVPEDAEQERPGRFPGRLFDEIGVEGEDTFFQERVSGCV